MAIRVFGFKIKITLEHILLNELPSEKLKIHLKRAEKPGLQYEILTKQQSTVCFTSAQLSLFCIDLDTTLRLLGLWRRAEDQHL